MKKILYILALIVSFSSFGQFSNEDLDKIINERTWCITSLTVNGEKKKNDGKWFYISGMKLVYGEDDYINGVDDILNKKYNEDGITITSLFYGREETLNFKIPKENHSLMADGVNEITNLKDTYVELISEINDGKDYVVARLTCTSLIGRWGSFPIKNWNGKNENNDLKDKLNEEKIVEINPEDLKNINIVPVENCGLALGEFDLSYHFTEMDNKFYLLETDDYDWYLLYEIESVYENKTLELIIINLKGTKLDIESREASGGYDDGIDYIPIDERKIIIKSTEGNKFYLKNNPKAYIICKGYNYQSSR